jgi:hypothetical protein
LTWGRWSLIGRASGDMIAEADREGAMRALRRTGREIRVL